MKKENINIPDIIKKHYRKKYRWDKYIRKSSSASDRFLKSFFPFFEFVYIQLSADFDRLKNIGVILSDQSRGKIIFTEMKSNLLPKSLRAFVLELNIERQNKKLLGNTPEERFDFFISLTEEPGFTFGFLKKYPVLKDQIASYIEQYLNFMRELLSHFVHDFHELNLIFLKRQKKGRLILKSFETGGDVHRRGKKVVILKFFMSSCKKQLSLVYKPRSLDVDRGYQRFLDWFNGYYPLKVQLPQFINRESHGWVEYIEHEPCHSHEEVRNYYSRLGAILAILYLLSGSDIHAENLIARGEHPFIVDLECSLLPLFDMQETENVFSRPLVIDSFLLPKKLMAHSGCAGFDISAFGATGGELYPQKTLLPVNEGKDYMTVERKENYSVQQKNMPTLNQDLIDPLFYTDDFSDGFSRAYKIFLEHKAFLLSKRSPLKYFSHVETRVVLRSTAEYGKLLFESSHPLLLQDPAAIAKHFVWLEDNGEKKYLNPLSRSEIRDLHEGNIPIFTCHTNERALYDSYKKKVNLRVLNTGFERALKHIDDHINPADYVIQMNCVKQSFVAYRVNRQLSSNGKTGSNKETHFLSGHNTAPLADGAIETILHQVLNEIIKYSIVDADLVSWTNIQNVYRAHKTVWVVGHIGTDLYDGLAGIVLALAYARKTFNNHEYHRYFTLAYHSLLQLLSCHLEDNQEIPISLAVFSGLGGILYVLCVIKVLHLDAKAEIPIKKILDQFDRWILTADLDVMDGVMGYLAVIIEFRSLLKEDVFLHQAQACVSYLLDKYPHPSQFSELMNKERLAKPLLGAAHGVSGMAWALQKYYKIFPDRRVKEWIRDALSYERREYYLPCHNWPSFMLNPETQSLEEKNFSRVAWCHGAIGVGLTRIAMKADGWRDDFIDEEIAVALDTSRSRGLTDILNLCHGSFGCVELFEKALETGVIHQKEYNQVLTAVLEPMQKVEQFKYESLGEMFLPGLMLGASGVAYQLMRILYPGRVPSLLLLGAPPKQ